METESCSWPTWSNNERVSRRKKMAHSPSESSAISWAYNVSKISDGSNLDEYTAYVLFS